MKIKVPEIPDELADSMSIRWFASVGDTVSAKNALFRLENDKIFIDVTSPIAGVLSEVHAPTGAQVQSGFDVGELEPLKGRDTSITDGLAVAAGHASEGPLLKETTSAVPFVDAAGEKAVYLALADAIQMTVKQNIQQFVAAENMQRLYHGGSWDHNVDESDGEVGQLTEHQVELEIKYQDVADNDLSLLPKYIHETAESMTSQTVAGLLGVVQKSTQKSGNSVSVKEEGSFKDAFVKMLQKIEFSVGRDGQVQRPGLHLSPQMYEKIIPELQSADEAFKQKVEAITAEKEQQALLAEAERIAKYKTDVSSNG